MGHSPQDQPQNSEQSPPPEESAPQEQAPQEEPQESQPSEVWEPQEGQQVSEAEADRLLEEDSDSAQPAEDQSAPQAEETPAPAEAAEEAPAPEPATEQPAPAAPAEETPQPQEEVSLEWNSLEDVSEAIQAGNIPEAALPYVQALMPISQQNAAVMRDAAADYEQAKEQFLGLAKQLEEGGAEGATVIAEQVSHDIEAMEAMSQEHVNVSWAAFYARHPEFQDFQEKAQKGEAVPLVDTFAGLCENDLFNMFPDGSLLDKIEKAYEYAAFKTGTSLGAPAPEPAAPAPQEPAPAAPAPAAPAPQDATPQAEQQALVNEGDTAFSEPKRSIEEVSFEELLDRHDSLL